MAEENNGNTPTEQEEPENNGGATQGEETTSTVKWIETYQADPLEDDIKSAESDETVKCLAYSEQQKVNTLKVCRLQNAHKVHSEYHGIKNCVSLVLTSHTGRLTENVAAYLAKNEELKANLATCLENLKAAKSQMSLVRSLACKLDIARNDSCHSEQLNAMSALPKKNGKKGIQRFNAEVDAIVAEATALNGKSNDLFEAGVKFAGIQAFINIPSLESQIQKLNEDATSFAGDVQENLDATAEKIAACQEKYEAGVTSITTALYDRYHAQLTSSYLNNLDTSLDNLAGYECTDDTFNEFRSKLEEICENVEETFSQIVNCKEGGESKFKKPNQ